MTYTSIRPGKVWLDTNGNRIQAHGSSVVFQDGMYYWYGENKEKTVKGANVWHWGVRCYTSTDLYNWHDEGLIIPPDLEDPTSPLHPSMQMDRPHILYNEKTKKYVCWIKIMESVMVQSMSVLIADNFMGPYELIKTGYHPLKTNTGDFDLALDSTTQKAYIYYEKDHTELVCAELSDDYTEVTETFSSHFTHPHPPFTRESPVHFTRNNKHYLMTSGTTGYFPNESEVAIADDFHGPYTVLGNPHPKDRSKTSFNSQVNDVFKVEGTDQYIAIADRWIPKFPQIRLVSKLVADGTARMFRKGKEESHEKKELNNFNTAFANYVWLPIRFEGDMPIIDWENEWKVEDYI